MWLTSILLASISSKVGLDMVNNGYACEQGHDGDGREARHDLTSSMTQSHVSPFSCNCSD